MSEYIRKNGRIVEVHDSSFVVSVCENEACLSCAVKGMCSSDIETKYHLIELENDGITRNAGDEITILISTSTGIRGAFYAYLLPVIIVLVAIIIFQYFDLEDLAIGIISILILGLYFLILWLLRKRIEKQISITIE